MKTVLPNNIGNDFGALKNMPSSSAKSRSALLYFTCASEMQRDAAEEHMRIFAASRGYSVLGVFFDKADGMPHILVDLLDIYSAIPNSVIMIQSEECIRSFEISPSSLVHYASLRGIRIIFAKKSEHTPDEMNRFALRYLKYIDNYFGYGPITAGTASIMRAGCRTSGSFGRLPIGYRLADSVIEPSVRQAEAVNEIFSEFVKGVSVTDIEQIIKERFPDIKCPTRNQIYFILNNKRYVGCDEFAAALPPIIENRVWLLSRGEASRRGLNKIGHFFLLESVNYMEFGRLKPQQYCRAIHAPAYALENRSYSAIVDACKLEAAVLSHARLIIERDLDETERLCIAALAEYRRYSDQLSAVLSKRNQVLLDVSRNSCAKQFTQRSIANDFDKANVKLRLLDIEEEYDRYLLTLLSRSKDEITAFFDHMRKLYSLSAEEQKYFLGILVNGVTVSDSELIISFRTHRSKRLCASFTGTASIRMK